MAKYNFAIIEDDLEVRRTVSDYFAQTERLDCVMAVDSVEKFLKYHRDFLEVKLVLLDAMLSNRSSIFQIPHILQREPDVEVIMFTEIDDKNVVFQAFTHGATGYLIKDMNMEDLEHSLLSVLDSKGTLISPSITKKIINHFWPKKDLLPLYCDATLTEKEFIVMKYLKEGRTYGEISNYLGISINGVRYYIKCIYRKLHVKNRGELLRIELQQ